MINCNCATSDGHLVDDQLYFLAVSSFSEQGVVYKVCWYRITQKIAPIVEGVALLVKNGNKKQGKRKLVRNIGGKITVKQIQ